MKRLEIEEISYIHAEGYPAAEMKHGPIALIDEDMPVVFIATQDEVYEKVVSNIQEVSPVEAKSWPSSPRRQKGPFIGRPCFGDPQGGRRVDAPAHVVPLQILSYHIALKRGCNVDQLAILRKASPWNERRVHRPQSDRMAIDLRQNSILVAPFC